MVGAAVAGIGLVTAVAWIASGVGAFFDQIDDFQRVPLGEEAPVTFTGTGGYTLYYEGPGADDSDYFYGPSDFSVEIAPVDGRPLRLSDYDADVTYAHDGREGRALYSFQIDDPGTYVVSSTSPPGEVGELAVGRGLGRRLVGPIVGGIALGLWSVGGGIGIILLTALRRRDARRRQAAPAMIR